MKKKKSNGSLIVSIGTAVPDNRYRQQAIADFMIRFFGTDDESSRKLSVIYNRSGIEFRHSVLPDFFADGKKPRLFIDPQQNPVLTNRLQIYGEEAIRLAAKAATYCLQQLRVTDAKRLLPVTHLITVSCTGMSAPGLDLQLMQELSLPGTVHRTSVNFMGCYAAFHALKIADAICRSDEAAMVMIVMVELCSLHFQPEMDSQNMVVNSLFADGAAAMLITSGRKCRQLTVPALRLNSFYSRVIHEGAEMMTWKPAEMGFLMRLDSMVPQLIEEHSNHLMKEAMLSFGSKRSKVTHWAIHPGGRKILEAVQRGMQLSNHNLKESYAVLRSFGNMSSPSIAFVLKMIMQEKLQWKKKEKIFAAGFGPGLTIETAMLQPVIT
ncbi:MAG: type III polyketide synthase [Chitinophagales bacterium]|nr:type III polyketide synthase [Chitinophagales bacterium]